MFVGGQVAELLVTDASVVRMRPTDDVDVVVPLKSATDFVLEPGLAVRIAAPSAYLATKWVAFASRGAADPMSSHDLEDLVAVVAGRAEIVGDVQASPPEVRQFICRETAAFLAAPWAAGILEGNLPDARRVPGLVEGVTRRFRQLASLD